MAKVLLGVLWSFSLLLSGMVCIILLSYLTGLVRIRALEVNVWVGKNVESGF